ncbi:ScyD/ScyE family protein [Actinoplanes sp. CA-030573]|uniref:ScyD/ScyE family protein n=1 Tax=Actinoplanes sp. CA-030573 TaxID=3239898 RepID=UPI003D94FACF
MRKLRAFAILGMSALTVIAAQPAYASAGHGRPPVRTITEGLDGPYGLQITRHGHALVAEGDSGEITDVDLRTGAQRTVIADLQAPSGVATHGDKIYVTLGGGSPDGPPPPSKYPPASLLVAKKNGTGVRVLADLQAYELKHNPDGQVQFDKNGNPYDALSNPFSLTDTPWGLLVADGGANDVLRVDPHSGRVSTYFVPPTAKTPACLKPEAQANPGTIGCDPVPTGVAVQGRYVYVSTLGAESPGASVVWKLDGRTGRVLHKWTGFTALTGVAVSPRGTIYASEVLFGAPEGDGPPPPGFDPATVGRLTRIDHGHVTHAAVTMPTGLRYVDGHLYATSWSIAGLLGIPHAGKLVDVSDRAFH